MLEIAAALGESGLPASRLELEITETVTIQNAHMTTDILHELQRLGVRISLDHFGADRSSLNHLRAFPFDKIKIDRSFVQSISSDERSSAIIKALAILSAGLGMSIAAEGVENREQLKRLRVAGCSEVQGPLFSPAKPAREIAELLTPQFIAKTTVA